MRRLNFILLTIFLACQASAQTIEEQLALALQKTPHPTNAAEFNAVAHLPCLNQGNTFVCWSFATASFFESEMARLKMEPVRLSVFYPVYCGYLEKARRFVATRGASRFSPGDLFTGAFDAYGEYGALPASLYDRERYGASLDHSRLYAELDDLMSAVKRQNKWDEASVLSRVKRILNRHLGEPPTKFNFKGKACTPKSFCAEIVRLPWSDYIYVTSFQSAPFNACTELNVPDNWRHNTHFFNVPLPIFYDSLKQALQSGFPAAADIDITEPSYKITGRYGMIPDSDIPASLINQQAREIRFLNGATTDDHLIALTGYKRFDGEDWFLAKDSWKKAWQDGNKGDVFLHGPFVKLKLLSYVVHRDAVPQIAAILQSGNAGK